MKALRVLDEARIYLPHSPVGQPPKCARFTSTNNRTQATIILLHKTQRAEIIVASLCVRALPLNITGLGQT